MKEIVGNYILLVIGYGMDIAMGACVVVNNKTCNKRDIEVIEKINAPKKCNGRVAYVAQ